MDYSVQYFRDALTALVTQPQAPEDPPARRQLRSLGNVIMPANLTRRELQVVEALVDGYRNREIGLTLGITADTVRSHLQNIRGKLGATNRGGIVGHALRVGLVA